MAREALDRLYGLLDAFLARRIEVGQFCALYSSTYDRDVDEDDMTPGEEAAFARLFDEVLFYSPFPRDRAKYPGYRSEEEIIAAARAAVLALRREKN